MLKKLLILLYIPLMLYAGNVYKDYYFDTPLVRDGKVSMDGCRPSFSPGKPCLAVKPITLLLPRGQEAVSFEVHYDGFTTLNSKYEIKPFPAAGEAENDTRSVYNQNTFYPNSVKSDWFRTQYKNGNGIFVTTVNPVQYNPVTKEVQYCRRVSVTVQTRFTRTDLPYKCTPFIKNRIASLVDNPEAVYSLPLTKRGADDYEYLIITTDALKDSWTTFIDFNKRRCLRAKVQTIDYIKANISGTDDADKMRNYIKQEYTSYNIVYVLLAGDDDSADVNDIPHRGMRAEAYDYGTDYYNDNDIPADLYYSCLDGDWKGDSTYYGEPGNEDIGWEVYAARFPADDATELSNIINKTIKYSEEPVASELKNNLFAGENLWGPPSHPVQCWGKNLMVQLIGTCNANSYTTTGFPAWNTSTLYDNDASWTSAIFISAVNDNKIAWINHVGHANNTYVFKHANASVTNANYTNNGTNANFFIAYTQSGYAGSFDNKQVSGSYTTNDCIGEVFTCGISNGAVAFIACSRYFWGDDGVMSADGTNGSNQRLHRYFHDAMFNKKIHNLEMMNACSKEMNIDIILDNNITNSSSYFGQLKWAAYTVNVLGDPALSVWTDTPGSLNPTYDTILTDSSFEVQTPSYSWVALCAQTQRGDSIICTQLTDSGGSCVIDDQVLIDYVTANPQGNLKLRIKAHNYYPYLGDLSINLLGDYPELFDTSGTDTDLPVSLRADGSDTVDIYYQLLDKDLTIDTVSAQYRNGTSGTWTTLTNTAGNVGPVSGADSSIHWHIRWYALGQLTNSFESDSVQVKITVSDIKGLSDTLSMANADLTLDFKAPDTVTSLTATPVSPTEIELTWNVSASPDVDSQLVIYGITAISTINDTTGNTWFMLADTVDSISAAGLTTDTKHYFAVFVCDEVPNWCSGSFTTGTTPNVPPVCQIDPITIEQSDSVTITFSLSDTENDTLSITCSYSTDGATWTNTSVVGVPAAIPDSLYSGGKKLNAIWPSKAVLPDRYIDSLYFRITPSDENTGTADFIIFQLDNYHNQSIALTTPTGVQSGNVVIPFTVTDTSGDSISFSCSYSTDGGTNWSATQNVDITKVGPAGYSGNITWSSAADIGIQDIPTAQFRIVPSDGWQNGTTGTTNNFHVNNSNIPLVIEMIQQPVVQNDTVTVAIRITAPNYSAITIDNASYSIDDGAHVTATLTTGYIIQSTSYDSAVIIWTSKQNYTSNSSNVKLHFTFKADTNSQQLTTQPFALQNNETPSVTVPPISGEQNGDVDVSFTISDLDYDTIKVFAQYSEDGIVWTGATVSGDTSGIDSSKYASAGITWKSGADFPDALQKLVWLKITPFDLDTGKADSIQITITNQGIPTCDPLTLPGGDTLNDSITINYTLSDNDNDSLGITLYYSSDTGWVQTGNVSGKTSGIAPSEYSGSLIWLSKSDLLNTLVLDMQLKLVPRDKSLTGQSGESRQFILDNLDSALYMTGDFNKDDKVNFLDFSYVSEYWYKSAIGINHPDSIQELAPATGNPPYLTVIGDALFNYEDLSVFVRMYYWSLENSEQDIITLATLEDQYPDNITAGYKTDFLVSGNKDNIAIHCNVKEVSDLVSCRYILFYNPEILAYNFFDGDNKFLEEEKGDIFSRVQKEKGKIDIGMTRLASGRYSVSGSGTISDIIFTRKNNIASEVTICYTLINSEHDEIESGIAKIEIHGSESVVNSFEILPNPSKVATRNIPLQLVNNENAIQWVHNDKSGFVFRINLSELSSEKNIKAIIFIFDALGNLVNKTPETNITFNNEQPLNIYWSGHNRNGRKIGSGIYKLIFIYQTSDGKNSIVKDIGVRE